MNTKKSKQEQNYKDNSNLKSQLSKILIDYIQKEPNQIFAQLIENLSKKPEFTDKISQLLGDKISVPINIFIKELTPLEALTKFLKENRKFSLHQIGELLERNERNLWHTYDSSKQKYPDEYIFTKSEIQIPLQILTKTRLSIAESVVVYLKEQLNLSYHNIAVLLHRNDRTVWTVYRRAKKKQHEKEN